MNDAKTYHECYITGKFEEATSGFDRLTQEFPCEPYFHSMLGATLEARKPVMALQRHLMALSMLPSDSKFQINTFQSLCKLGLYPAALIVDNQLASMNCRVQNIDNQKLIVVARGVTCAYVNSISQCTASDISIEEKPIIDELSYPYIPWLTSPELARSKLAFCRIFISYRRQTARDESKNIEDYLRCFPAASIFRDETGMEAARNFKEQIREEIEHSDVFLLLIDSDFVGAKGNASRIMHESDIFRREIEWALKSHRVVVPILLNGANMPDSIDIPSTIHDICNLHAISLRNESFENDFEKILKAISARLVETNREMDACEQLLSEAIRNPSGESAKYAAKVARDFLPKYEVRSGSTGSGIDCDPTELIGHWHCRFIHKGFPIVLDFVLFEAPKHIFTGNLSIKTNNRFLGLFNILKSESKIEGEWIPVYGNHQSKDKLSFRSIIGIRLTGRISDERFDQFIPTNNKQGPHITGIGADGTEYFTILSETKEHGF